MAQENLREFARQLHERLLEGDPVASAELAEALLEELVRRVRAKAGSAQDEDLIFNAAVDAFLYYVQQPAKYDPTKSSLLTYLTMSAYGDFLNAAAREGRRLKRLIPLDDVELRLSVRNSMVEEMNSSVLEQYGIDTPEDKASILRKVEEAFPDPRDRRLLELILRGERNTAVYARLLELDDREVSVQRRTVKQHKDRITKRLQRLGSKIRGPKRHG